ncbi:hypothetical protein RND71_042602 [Anisodus tanguticus]|uniref:Polyphenol oxidase C-terminal domain-containing protein n=1 Tax=Anisodus tanguticus TaxID=243964 RepID=A0AAE1QR88_9SOLA|nr:hypothetical protein RND71_042602 [Anisodus tanguticus]
MKELEVEDPSDSRGFKQQANIHCAYCNGTYKADGKELQNWDHPKGMHLPHAFDQPNVHPDLYDPRRNQNHRESIILDLGHFGVDVKATDLQTMSNNLTLMYRQMITIAPCAQLFFGKPYCVESGPRPGQGAIENIPHTLVHIWIGIVRGSNLGDGKKSNGRTQQEKDAKEEMLTFRNLAYVERKNLMFGPHVIKPVEKFQLAITELLEDIGLEDEDTIVVTLVLKTGGELVAIESVVIELLDC